MTFFEDVGLLLTRKKKNTGKTGNQSTVTIRGSVQGHVIGFGFRSLDGALTLK